jgi:hypothetical protein
MAIHSMDANLAAQQNEDTSRNGKNRQDNSQVAHRNKRSQSREYEPDTQQQKADIFREFHGNRPFFEA